MRAKLVVPSYGRLGKFLDWIMIPIMYLVSGTIWEAPQRTHRWNNKKLPVTSVSHLDENLMVFCEGVVKAGARRGIIFHLPIFGGWRDYVVIGHCEAKEWHVGWITEDARGVSKLRMRGPIRMLLGPKPVKFFGINADTFEQITIQEMGRGRIGEDGIFSDQPLL